MEEPEPAADIIDFPNLISNVSHTYIAKWTDDIVTKFGDDKSGIIKRILESVKQDADSQDPNNASILNAFKDMQRRYVHVSLFASLSYVYITNMLEQQKARIQAHIQANIKKIADLQQQLEASQQSATTVAALQKEINTLAAQNVNFKTLESDLQERARGLSTFITTMADLPAAAAGEGTGPGGGSKKKKRAQKGGFVRDGTRASLAGDPYPNAS